MNDSRLFCPHCKLHTELNIQKKTIDVTKTEYLDLVIISYRCCDHIFYIKEASSKIEPRPPLPSL